jgi:hypothetical protein
MASDMENNDVSIHEIKRDAVYTVETATKPLDLADTTILTEIRRKRLCASRRAGRYFILGEWLLRWIAEGDVREEETGKRANNRISALEMHRNGD